MNERIKELALQAGDDQKKFAELIIEDCVACCRIVERAAGDVRVRAKARGDDFNYFLGREEAAFMCQETIQKHFGEGK